MTVIECGVEHCKFNKDGRCKKKTITVDVCGNDSIPGIERPSAICRNYEFDRNKIKEEDDDEN